MSKQPSFVRKRNEKRPVSNAHPRTYLQRTSSARLDTSRTMPTRVPNFIEIDGIKIPPFFSVECFRSALSFRPKDGDIFVVTYPKCGTTWMQNVVLNLLRGGVPLERPRDFFLASPFLDQLGAEDSEKMMIRPGAYKTHLPFEKIPWSEAAKYIYVARNPKDCCVSYYHHMRQIVGYQFTNATFDEFFDMFMDGNVDFNDYFTHFLSWYKERNRHNVFFTTYEQMKSDLRDVVLKVAAFLGTESERFLLDNPGVFNKIVRNCSFDEMKFINTALNSLYRSVDELMTDPKVPRGRKHVLAYSAQFPQRQIDFIRKGEIGSWKETFTDKQNQRMNEKIKTISQCSDVMNIWKEVL